MWNPVELVAKHHNVDPAALVDYALSRDSKYSITVERGTAMVSNFHVEDLLRDFQSEDESTNQWIKDYLVARQNATGITARVEPVERGFLVIDENEDCTGIPYSEDELRAMTENLRMTAKKRAEARKE